MAGPGAIRRVVIIVKEQRSFDSYFGTFPGADGDASPGPPPPATLPPPRQDHGAWLRRLEHPVRAQFRQADLPAYFAYARQFTLCDRYFSDVAGPATPNQLMLLAAASMILVEPPPSGERARETFDLPHLPARLERAGLPWHIYGGHAWEHLVDLQGHPALRASERFARDALAGTLGAVSWVHAQAHLSERHPWSVTERMRWTAEQVGAVVAGGLWPSVAIFVVWDSWGGWFDHVAPPLVERWRHDDYAVGEVGRTPPHLRSAGARPPPWLEYGRRVPARGCSPRATGGANGFDDAQPGWPGTQLRYGSRVGCLVLSPYAKRGYVSRVQRSHVSLLRYCEQLFGLPPLNARDAAADAMDDCFDFRQEPLPPPRIEG